MYPIYKLIKDRRVKLVLLVLTVFIFILSIKKQEFNSSFLLKSNGDDVYHGEIIHVDGYAVRFPFRIYYYVKGTATINDLELDMNKLSYSRKSRTYSLLLSYWEGDRLYLNYNLDSEYYSLKRPGYASYTAIPLE